MAIITLTTDFGTRDGYVGAMKGVIARLSPDARVVDIAHDVPRGDIAHAAWVLLTATREFPDGAIHVCVVDPGVGGARREVVVDAQRAWYIGPDNGVFAYVAGPRRDAWVIENLDYRAPLVSRTFHGRDVFAVTAAVIAAGGLPARVGPRVQLRGTLPWGPREAGQGRIVHIDAFGNLITDLPASETGAAVRVADRLVPLVGTYEDVQPGELLAYIGSARTVEIAVRDGRADRRLMVVRGALVLPANAEAGGPYR